MLKVILDTNFLIYCAEKKIDYAAGIASKMTEGYELVIPNQVKEELEKLKKEAKKYSDRVAASLALQLLIFNKVKVEKIAANYADEAIIRMFRFNVVATLDDALRKRVGRALTLKEGKLDWW